MRILYIGPLIAGSTTLQRLWAFEDLGHAVSAISTTIGNADAAVKPSLARRMRRRLLGPEDETSANEHAVAAVQRQAFDLVWIDKGLTIQPATLRRVREFQPRCKIVGFSPDDMMNRANQSRHFLRGLPLYHTYVTNKSYNVAELQALGCPRVIFTDNGFCPRTHRPMAITDEDRKRFGGEVGFIGQWEPERAESLRFLAENGIRVRVWGYTWKRMKQPPPNLVLENKPLWGDDYARAICAFDINLCFLRKCNRDLQTTRSIEIPACGGFMLAERTAEHARLFREGEEAGFFEGNQELLAQVRLYLREDARRNISARNGRKRCLSGGYSNTARLANVLKQLDLGP